MFVVSIVSIVRVGMHFSIKASLFNLRVADIIIRDWHIFLIQSWSWHTCVLPLLQTKLWKKAYVLINTMNGDGYPDSPTFKAPAKHIQYFTNYICGTWQQWAFIRDVSLRNANAICSQQSRVLKNEPLFACVQLWLWLRDEQCLSCQ